MSQPQPSQQQPQQSKPQTERPRIARLVFVHAISFAGGIESASTDAGPAAVQRLGSGIDIRPATMTPHGPRVLEGTCAFDGYLLSKTFSEQGKQVKRVAFVDRHNVKELTLNVDC